jgi:hypothetical protein
VKDLSPEGLERMLASDATPFERELLEAGARERPAPELLLAMQRSLGIGPDVAQPLDPAVREPTAPPAPAATTSGAWSSAALLKVGIGATVAAGVVVAALSLPSRPSEPAPSSPPAVTAAAPSEPPPSEARVQPSVTEAPPSAPDPARALRLEIELLDRARAAQAAGEPARALGLLDEYAARFPGGTLSREAQVLRGKIAKGDGMRGDGSRSKVSSDPATLEAPARSTPARP